MPDGDRVVLAGLHRPAVRGAGDHLVEPVAVRAEGEAEGLGGDAEFVRDDAGEGEDDDAVPGRLPGPPAVSLAVSLHGSMPVSFHGSMHGQILSLDGNLATRFG